MDTPRSIARAATITSFGNLSSRVIGLGRDIVKSYFFGNGQAASAFELASNVPTQFNDLLAGGMLSSALVPTFSATLIDDSNQQQRESLGRLLGSLIGITLMALVVIISVLWAFAHPIAVFITGGINQDIEMVAGLLRITIPAILFLNLSGIFAAALHARRRFAVTAFTAALFNISMIACVILFEGWLGINALAIGLLVGSMMQMLLQIWGLRGIPIRLSLNWRHPGLAQIVRLYLPVAAGLVLAQIGVQLSFIVASRISPEGPATMRYAAQVVQFPLGMIASAVSAAILPALSAIAPHQRASDEGEDDPAANRHANRNRVSFNATLAQGLRLVLMLIMPASVGLYALALPVVGLLFERGAFDAASTAYTAEALRAAVPGLLFAAIDQPLIFAFYARRNTRTPTLIGLASNVFYLLLVGGQVWLDAHGLRVFSLADLVLANSLKTGFDALLMATFLSREINGLRRFGLGAFTLKVLAAAAGMGVAVVAVMQFLQAYVGSVGLFAHAVVVIGAGLIGAALYFGLGKWLGLSWAGLRAL
ncbi:MAG: murein biosynthesis integral membrane protein MurJ [Anaerolineae bacterium]|nr:murein biosynthesis integral membrane protein MurJ [Anaerolineae bacterium]